MTKEQRVHGIAGLLLLAAVVVLAALFVRSPRVTPEANLRYASDSAEAENEDMAELLQLLNGE